MPRRKLMSGRKQVQQCWCRPTNLFDHLVGAGEQRCRDVKAEHFRGLEIDHKLEFGRCLHWKIGGFSPLRMRLIYSAARRYGSTASGP